MHMRRKSFTVLIVYSDAVTGHTDQAPLHTLHVLHIHTPQLPDLPLPSPPFLRVDHINYNV